MEEKREKALRLFRKLHALARSPNENEAKRAVERAESLVRKYGFTDADAEPDLPVQRRAGGSVSGKGDWRERVAYGVASRWACRPLRGAGQVVFEGVKAVEAVVEYRRIVREIEEAQDRCWRAYDYKYRLRMQEDHRRRFTEAAAEMTVQFATMLGEDHHTLQVDFEREGRREARAIMRNLALEKWNK